jgi:oxygen-independent coproporphyrinogen-3 oxidase
VKPASERTHRAATASATGAVALYLHLPFCDHRCAYCDFNAYAGLEQLIPSYCAALGREATLWRAPLAERTIHTVFLGGGTPSLTPLPLLETLFATLRETFAIAPDAEITLEANPGTVDEPYLRGLRKLGVNRLSLGVQSFDDGELRLLDRIHDAATAENAFLAARRAGFDNVNLDLMFGLQAQGIDGWRHNLGRALALRPEHLSLYALTVEDGTKLARQVQRGLMPAPDPDLQADMYALATETLAAAGYGQYEISNWSLPGRACRHNLVYWRNEPYAALGAGAHGHLCGRRFAVVRVPAAYIERVRSAEPLPPDPASLAASLPQVAEATPDDALTDASDTLILGLRLNEGVDLAAFAARYGHDIDAFAGPAIAELSAWGLLERGDGRLRLTDRGRFVASEVFVRLLPEALTLTAAG